MDNLSSLSSGLPPNASLSQELAALDSSIISEFKTAACAVTKLYKLSGAKSALIRQQGYLDAVQDLVEFITERSEGEGSGVSVDEVMAWAIDKQDTLNAGRQASASKKQHKQHQQQQYKKEELASRQQQFVLDPAYQFSFSHPELLSQAQSSTPPLSFMGQLFNFGQQTQPEEPATSSAEANDTMATVDDSDSGSDDEVLDRTAGESVKRRMKKFTTASSTGLGPLEQKRQRFL